MNISNEHKCIFIHIPKAAGTSVKKALDLPGRGHPSWQYFAANYPDEWKAYKKFTVVRNPWERVVSAFCYAKMENSFWHGKEKGLHPDHNLLRAKSFTECCMILQKERDALTHESWHPQHLWIAGTVNGKLVPTVDRVLRCESLDRDFAKMCQLFGFECSPLPHINASAHKHYKKYYNPKTRKIIARLYSTDIELFGYSF